VRRENAVASPAAVPPDSAREGRLLNARVPCTHSAEKSAPADAGRRAVELGMDLQSVDADEVAACEEAVAILARRRRATSRVGLRE